MVTKANGQLHRGIISVTFAITDTRINFVGTKLLYFPQIIARGDYFFLAPKGVDYLREAFISNIAHRRSCCIYFVSLFH